MKKQLLLITILLTTFFSFGQVPNSERNALIALYNSTDGANWTNNTNWNTANPVSSWYGITVENISGQDHVTTIDFGYYSNNLNGTLPPEIGTLTELKNMVIGYNSLLTGSLPIEIGNCTNLIQFEVVGCNISGNIPMEFSNLTSLEHLYFEGNQLSGAIPNIFNSMNLKSLSLSNNNFSGNLILTNTNNTFYYIGIDNNQFGSFDFRNGYNTNISNSGYFKVQDNPNLSCVFVDDATYSATNWTNIDATATFLETQVECDALFTSIPDDNFEQALIDEGYDNIMDDKVKTSNINSLTSLDVKNKSISDLTGINDFVALSYLNIGNNNISVIDLSNNVNLTGLFCYNNNLTNLSLDNNPDLTVVNCSGNELTEINLSNNLALVGFYCALNNLTGLDLSSNNLIDKLWCYDNNLTELDIRNGANNLLSGTFTAGSDTYAKFRATENPNLTCIYVDNANDANDFVGDYLNWEIDTTSAFVETETECNALSINNETFKQYIEIYPNPTSAILHIRNNENLSIKKIAILNTLGQKIINSQAVSNIDISNLPNGIYYINIENIEGNKVSYKIIKE